jgi:hypothetical protein
VTISAAEAAAGVILGPLLRFTGASAGRSTGNSAGGVRPGAPQGGPSQNGP